MAPRACSMIAAIAARPPLLAILALVCLVAWGWLVPAVAAGHGERPRPRAHVPGWQVGVFAVLPRGIRLMVEDADGSLIVSGYRAGNVWRVKRDRDGDGRSDGAVSLVDGLNLPHGLLLDGGWLYVAEEHRVVRFRHRPGVRPLGRMQVVLRGIPRGGHVSRTLKKGPDGWLYLSIGSSCNVCIEDHPWRAAIIRFRVDRKGRARDIEIFARGLRNAVGFDWRPGEGVMYAVNAGSDWMGDDRPREELNRVRRGGHHGWPFVHENGLRDPRFWPLRPRGARFVPPVHTFTAHSTPLSIRFLRHQPDIRPGSVALVGRRGSWNRSRKAGYDVLWVEFGADGRITHRPFLTGFLRGQKTLGRPVDVLETRDGTVFITDDHAGLIYRAWRRKVDGAQSSGSP